MREVLQAQDTNAYTAAGKYSKQAGDEPLREWRAKWRHIMKDAVIYFDSIPAPQIEHLKPYIAELGSHIQPFFDQRVSHVISENHRSEVSCKARDASRKVYTLEKLSRFITSLLGHTVTPLVGEVAQQQIKLAKMLETDARQTTSRKDDFYFFKGPYVLVWDPSTYNRPLCIKEWKSCAVAEEGEWPQLRKAPMGMSPFTARAVVRSEKRRHDMHKQEKLAMEKLAMEGEIDGDGNEDEDAEDREMGEKRRKCDDKENIPHPDGPVVTASVNRQTLGNEAPEPQVETQTRESQFQGSQRDVTAVRAQQYTSRLPSVVEGAAAMAPLAPAAAATPSVRLREFGEIVASGVPRYSQTSKSFTSKEAVSSRELANLRRKVMPRPHAEPNEPAAKPPVEMRVPKVKPMAKKPGWCENCLEKYEDLAEHVAGKSHRSFALNDQKFAALDAVIALLQRN